MQLRSRPMAINGVNEANVTAWFAANVEGAKPPLSFELIAGGHSNLTFGVTDSAGDRWVLRRPPLGHVLATAHDMRREHKIISALGPTPVPVAPAIGLCTDDDVNGAPFYVMGFVDGNVIRDAEVARTKLDEAGRRTASESIADVMADIHAVDVDAVGLGDLGKKEGYIGRQLKRWYSQFQQSQELTERPVPWSTRCTTPSPAASVTRRRHDRPWRLPPRQLHARIRRPRCCRSRLGDLHARRPLGRCRVVDGLLERGHRSDAGVGDERGHRRSRLLDASRDARALCEGVRPRPVSRRLLHRISVIGSSRASSRGCTRATRTGQWASLPPASRPSPRRRAVG